MRKLLVLMFFILLLSYCVKESVPSVKEEVETFSIKSDIFGVGMDEGKAQTDLYSVYYAMQKGVFYQIDKGELKLKMDYTNSGEINLLEGLTEAKIKKIEPAFYLYVYPYRGNVNIKGTSGKRVSTVIQMERPFSFISRLLAKAIISNYTLDKKISKKGYAYILSMDYKKREKGGIVISSEILITEKKNLAYSE